jgi:two-component system chemotaxis response regulator CheY
MSKILIVDDSDLIRNQVATVLVQAGYEVVEAEDGVQGLDAAKTHKPDLVITDLNMPNMNGLELITKLREDSSFDTTEILMLTTETNAGLRKKGA